MVTELHCPLTAPDKTQRLACSACGTVVWERGWPFPVFEPCPHLLLFTDAEGERESWCTPALLSFARARLGDPGEPTGGDLLDAEGWLFHSAHELIAHLPRPEDPPLWVAQIEGEHGDGLVLATAPLELDDEG